jgi:heptosyltransferase III
MLHVAILCAQGLGDALLMMITAHHYAQNHYQVTFYYNQPDFLKPLFPYITIAPYPPLEAFPSHFQHYDLLLVENDHSKQAWALSHLRSTQVLPNITFLFPTPSKHSYTPRDYLFNSRLPVATNLQHAMQKLLQLTSATKENGLVIPQGMQQRYDRRIALHPTSKDPQRNWKQSQFLSLACRLKNLGYDPYFVLNTAESPSWQSLSTQGYQLFVFSSLLEITSFLYESRAFIGNDSGLGHLASNLGIPTVTISGNPKRVQLWRPDWAFNRVATLPCPLPNFKGIQWAFREKYWQNFVTVGRVLNNFKRLISMSSQQPGSHDS